MISGLYVDSIFPTTIPAVAGKHVRFFNKELSPPILEKQFREACQALSIKPPMPRNAISCEVDYVKSVKDGEKILQRAIVEYRFFLLPISLVIALASVKSDSVLYFTNYSSFVPKFVNELRHSKKPVSQMLLWLLSVYVCYYVTWILHYLN
ncbi:unnamed protein product [Ilex paraguariensis]|uniref:Uncharacterized protein n=1 Tax=Ilex paraguariensis TaxID=185542 RepID=A0ABC8SGG6_9AQUA